MPVRSTANPTSASVSVFVIEYRESPGMMYRAASSGHVAGIVVIYDTIRYDSAPYARDALE